MKLISADSRSLLLPAVTHQERQYASDISFGTRQRNKRSDRQILSTTEQIEYQYRQQKNAQNKKQFYDPSYGAAIYRAEDPPDIGWIVRQLKKYWSTFWDNIRQVLTSETLQKIINYHELEMASYSVDRTGSKLIDNIPFGYRSKTLSRAESLASVSSISSGKPLLAPPRASHSRQQQSTAGTVGHAHTANTHLITQGSDSPAANNARTPVVPGEDYRLTTLSGPPGSKIYARQAVNSNHYDLYLAHDKLGTNLKFYGVGVEQNGEWRKLALKGGAKEDPYGEGTSGLGAASNFDQDPREWQEYTTQMQTEIEQLNIESEQHYTPVQQRFTAIRSRALTAIRAQDYNALLQIPEALGQLRVLLRSNQDEVQTLINRIETEFEITRTWNDNHPNMLISEEHSDENIYWLNTHHQMNLHNLNVVQQFDDIIADTIQQINGYIIRKENITPIFQQMAPDRDRQILPSSDGPADLRRV